MIKICDAIMGSGKSTACINYMNANPGRRFIYISPYLEEDDRIWAACRSLHFVRPNNISAEDEHTKFNHTKRLLRDGRNICTTHQLFRRYDQEMLDDIRRRGYTLVCDEVIDAIESVSVHADDVAAMLDLGLIKIESGKVTKGEREYRGTLLQPFLQILDEREMFYAEPGEGEETDGPIFTWILPPQLLQAFRDVYVLTYMFRGQNMKYMMDMYDLPYRYIGVRDAGGGRYEFDETVRESAVPAYLAGVHDLITVYRGENLNAIGDKRTALSQNWFRTEPEAAEQLRRHLDNWFRTAGGSTSVSERMWGTLKCAEKMLSGKGYTSAYVVFNKRASNSYREKTCLAYACNVFMNVSQVNFLKSAGVTASHDAYALSTMIQWIWRSAIREGRHINIYVPSRRMREMLLDWMDEIAEKAGGRACRSRDTGDVSVSLPSSGRVVKVPFSLEGCRVVQA